MGLRLQLVCTFIVMALVISAVADTDSDHLPPRRHWIDSHTGRVVVIVVSIFVAVVAIAVLLLCLYSCYWTAQPEAAPPAPAAEPAPVAPRLHIGMFPLSTYTAGGRDALRATGCPMCLTEYSEGQRLRTFPCRHYFDEDCIEGLLSAGHTACPMCRADLSASTSST